MGKVYVLIMSDAEMRPRADIVTSAVFPSRESAMAALEQDISSTVENEQVTEGDLERSMEHGFVLSKDGRFFWKVEERIVVS